MGLDAYVYEIDLQEDGRAFKHFAENQGGALNFRLTQTLQKYLDGEEDYYFRRNAALHLVIEEIITEHTDIDTFNGRAIALNLKYMRLLIAKLQDKQPDYKGLPAYDDIQEAVDMLAHIISNEKGMMYVANW